MLRQLCIITCLLVFTAGGAAAQDPAQDPGRGDFLAPKVDYEWTIKSECRHAMKLAVRYTEDGARHTKGWITLRPQRSLTFRSTSNFVFYYARLQDGYAWRGDPDKSADILIRVDDDNNFAYDNDAFPSAAKDRIRFRGKEYTEDATMVLTCRNK